MEKTKTENTNLKCGVIMPISQIDGCSESHWSDVMEIISTCVTEAGFEANIVSNADDVGVIHKRIVQNLYDNPIVICDVSCRNPNVMFELGMRLAFDKPTIIIKDDKTSYSFDTSSIEHIEYPRDLRFNKIQEFKIKLTEKIKSTYKKSSEDPNFSTFLKNFGEFKVAKINTKEVSQQELIMDEIRGLRRIITNNSNINKHRYENEFIYRDKLDSIDLIDICLEGETDIENIKKSLSKILSFPGVISTEIETRSEEHYHLLIRINDKYSKGQIEEDIRKIIFRKRIGNKNIS
ncbi:hypothetical protein [Chryseobacterium scophthalmum]|uniref:hypothetical protein n=1 Tax=Chryseobacterium scophthalmum TaxID=59733 RepID=UPI0015E062C4|nr:hypothetical protein [Chryseobacterium scophthalmum]